jgi:hypothetical protein
VGVLVVAVGGDGTMVAMVISVVMMTTIMAMVLTMDNYGFHCKDLDIFIAFVIYE